MEEKLTKILERFGRDQLFTQACCEIGKAGEREPLYRAYYKTSATSVFDLASLTKVFVTANLVADFSQQKNSSLESSLSDFFGDVLDVPSFLKDLSVLEILQHNSKLPAWRNFYVECDKQESSNQDKILRALQRLKSSDLQTENIYSDIGYMLLGKYLTAAAGKPLSLLFEQWKKKNAISSELGYSHSLGAIKDFVPTGYCPLRQRMLSGEVHDENAAFMEQDCGHAGLFSSLEMFSPFLKKFVTTSSAKILLEQSFDYDQGQRKSVTTGFRAADDYGSELFFPGRALGHYGFTGTSFWYDPPTGSYVFLFTNRTFFKRLDPRIKELRRETSRLAYDLCK